MNFREAFCHQTGCGPEQYVFEVYRRCVRTKYRSLVRIAWLIEPIPVAASKYLIEKVGTTDRNDFAEDYINEFHERLEYLGGKESAFRISGKTLTKLFRATMRTQSTQAA